MTEQRLQLQDQMNEQFRQSATEIQRRSMVENVIQQLMAERARLEEMAAEGNFLSQSERQRRANQNEYLRSVSLYHIQVVQGKKRNTRKKRKSCNKGKKQSSKNRKGCSRRRSKKSRK